MSNINIVMNEEKNGIEIRFDTKPSDEILAGLKSNGFRWSNRQKIWYARQNDKTIGFAHELSGVSGDTECKTNNTKTYDLWDMTRTEGIGNNVDKSLCTKEIAALIRKHIRQRFPMFRISVTSDYNSIVVEIKSSPFAKDSDEFKAVKDYVEAYASSYKYCVCYDPYGDYGSYYNFYGGYCRVYYDYTQTEMTVSVAIMTETFQIKKAAFDEAEALRREQAYKAQMEQMKVEEAKAAERRKVDEANRKTVENGVKVFDGKDCFIKNLRDPKISKLNSSFEYDESMAEDDSNEVCYHICRVTRDVHMTADQFAIFDKMLLHDWSFIEKTGGSTTQDNRINSDRDFYMMSKEERDTVEWYSNNCVAIWCDGQLKYVVDAQGFGYCRYVYFPTEKTVISNDYSVNQVLSDEQADAFKRDAEIIIDISANVIIDNNLQGIWEKDGVDDYKREMMRYIYDHNVKFDVNVIRAIDKDYDTLKSIMYELLADMNGIQEQMKRARLMPGERITIVKMGDFGFIGVQRATFESVENCKYAQYDKAVKLVIRPENKRGIYAMWLHGDVMIYAGWLPDLPEDVLFDVTSSGGGVITKKSKYLSCDRRYYDLAYEYYAGIGALPLVNTDKPERRKAV